MTAEQVSAAFMSMGYDVEFDENPTANYKTYHFPETTYSIERNEDGTFRMVPETTIKPYTVEDSIAAPTIKTLTSTGSQGGGVSSKNRGKGAANKAKSTSKKSGQKGTKPKVWDNSYDKLYNLVEKTNEALRRREKIERDYDRLLKNRNMTASQLLANSLKQIANLREEIALQEQLRAGRLSQAQTSEQKPLGAKTMWRKPFHSGA